MTRKQLKVLLCGGSFSGNRGAEAMYDSVIDELSGYYDRIDVAVLSKYPKDDKRGCDSRGYHLFPFSTVQQLFFGGLFFLFGGVLKKLHLPYQWAAGKHLKPFFENDVLIDASGISFTDDRSFANVCINALWFLPALISGIPTVKVSQSLGPFEKKYVKVLSKMVLSKIGVIICRGERSFHYTKAFLKRDRIFHCPDVAFCLKPCGKSQTRDLLNKYGIGQDSFIAVGPSFVMRDFLDKGEYADMIANGINRLSRMTDKAFVFVPHSWKHSDMIGVDSVSDDISVCREIMDKLNTDVKTVLIDERINAHEFKSIIGSSYMAIGSRFHFLIAALSSGVPSMALGWSHKYHELFGEFGLEDLVIGYRDMDCDSVADLMEKLLSERDTIKDRINTELPDVIDRSKMNEKLIVEYLEGSL